MKFLLGLRMSRLNGCTSDAGSDAILSRVVGCHDQDVRIGHIRDKHIPRKNRIGYDKQQTADDRIRVAGHKGGPRHDDDRADVADDRNGQSILAGLLKGTYQLIANQKGKCKERNNR